ncbi:MAG: endonuclease domain-containing protein [Candidatus Contendobacter sp.]|nr:MAG: endonuclease domain-containing protein [Candidatus Contendobacter sp.]
MNSLLNNAKTLRSHQTDAEQQLWHQLRAHRFMGLKFKRQKPIGHYIVDFICIEYQLIIEVDGGQHIDQMEYDDERTAWLESEGFMVLRFWNHEVLQEMDGVLERIRQAVVETAIPSPPPLSRTRARGALLCPLPGAGSERL